MPSQIIELHVPHKVTQVAIQDINRAWVALFGFLPRSVLLEANGKFCAAVGNFCATVVAFGVFTVLKSSTL
jgi:hypothetical protein